MAAPRSICFVCIAALTLAACGGDDDQGSDTASDTAANATADDADPSPDEDTPAVEDDEVDPGEPAGQGSGAQVSIARFTAHGVDDPNTVAPKCATGEDFRDASEVYRFVMPDGWTWSGFSGGTGPDEIDLDTDDGIEMTVTEVATKSELPPELIVDGPAGADVDLDGTAFPLSEVTIGDTTGYAIVDLPYLEPFPLSAGAALGTVALTSAEPGRPTLDEAVELLSTVRVERCEAIAQALIYGSLWGVHLVPRFEPDPMGKTYPDQDQPPWVGGESPLEAYSIEQLAYLMPVEESRATCAAETVRVAFVDNPIGYFLALRPTGTDRAELEAVIAEC